MNHAKTLVYVAGPFSGKGATRAEQRADTELKIQRAVALGIKVAKLGAYPVIPHANTAHPEFEEVQPYQFWIDGTGELLLRCNAVLFTEDWETSSGARGENELAINAGIPRFFHLSDLACWLSPELAELTGSGAPTLTEPAPPPVRPTLDELAADLPEPFELPLSPDDVEVVIDGQPFPALASSVLNQEWNGDGVKVGTLPEYQVEEPPFVSGSDLAGRTCFVVQIQIDEERWLDQTGCWSRADAEAEIRARVAQDNRPRRIVERNGQ